MPFRRCFPRYNINPCTATNSHGAGLGIAHAQLMRFSKTDATEPPRRYVTIGRVAFVNLAEDPLYGKLVVIVNAIDQNRVRGAARRRRRKRRRLPRAPGVSLRRGARRWRSPAERRRLNRRHGRRRWWTLRRSPAA